MQHNELIKKFLFSLIAFCPIIILLSFSSFATFIRKLAATKNINLDVYTGTFGRLRLKDEGNAQHEIFLYVNGTTKQIPAPMLYYKILANHDDKSGIVLIGKGIINFN